MEAHVTIHDDEADAAAMAARLRDGGLQVVLAGPVTQTFLRTGRDDADEPIAGERWIVLAVEGGMIVVD